MKVQEGAISVFQECKTNYAGSTTGKNGRRRQVLHKDMQKMPKNEQIVPAKAEDRIETRACAIANFCLDWIGSDSHE